MRPGLHAHVHASTDRDGNGDEPPGDDERHLSSCDRVRHVHIGDRWTEWQRSPAALRSSAPVRRHDIAPYLTLPHLTSPHLTSPRPRLTRRGRGVFVALCSSRMYKDKEPTRTCIDQVADTGLGALGPGVNQPNAVTPQVHSLFLSFCRRSQPSVWEIRMLCDRFRRDFARNRAR